MKSLIDILNESKSKLDLKDFEFYRDRGSKVKKYSFLYKPTNTEGDIHMGYGKMASGGRGESGPYIDFIEFEDKQDEKTKDNFEEFIENNLSYIIKNSEEL